MSTNDTPDPAKSDWEKFNEEIDRMRKEQKAQPIDESTAKKFGVWLAKKGAVVVVVTTVGVVIEAHTLRMSALDIPFAFQVGLWTAAAYEVMGRAYIAYKRAQKNRKRPPDGITLVQVDEERGEKIKRLRK